MSRTYLAGTLVKVTVPDDEPQYGIVLEGPITRDGNQVYKLDHGEYENWYPVEWLSPNTDSDDS